MKLVHAFCVKMGELAFFCQEGTGALWGLMPGDPLICLGVFKEDKIDNGDPDRTRFITPVGIKVMRYLKVEVYDDGCA